RRRREAWHILCDLIWESDGQPTHAQHQKQQQHEDPTPGPATWPWRRLWYGDRLSTLGWSRLRARRWLWRGRYGGRGRGRRGHLRLRRQRLCRRRDTHTRRLSGHRPQCGAKLGHRMIAILGLHLERALDRLRGALRDRRLEAIDWRERERRLVARVAAGQ